MIAALTLGGTAQASSRRTLPGSTPGWAQAGTLRGNAPATDRVGFRVYLGWRDASAAGELAATVSTPGSATYGRYLTPQQFPARFAPSQSDLPTGPKWLRGAGFTV